MAPTLRKSALNGKRKFDNHRYFIIPKGKGDTTCRTAAKQFRDRTTTRRRCIRQPPESRLSGRLPYHLRAHHPLLWEEAERNAEAAGKNVKKPTRGVNKPEKEKPRRRVIMESDDEEEPSTSVAAAAPTPPVEDPQMGRRGTLEGEWPVERIETMRIAQNGQAFWWVKWLGYPDEQSTWEPTEHLAHAHRLIDAYLRTTWRRFLPFVPSFQIQ